MALHYVIPTGHGGDPGLVQTNATSMTEFTLLGPASQEAQAPPRSVLKEASGQQGPLQGNCCGRSSVPGRESFVSWVQTGDGGLRGSQHLGILWGKPLCPGVESISKGPGRHNEAGE